MRKVHKNPKGGLSEAGRKHFNRTTGSNLKRPVKSGDNPRRASFLHRMSSVKGPDYKDLLSDTTGKISAEKEAIEKDRQQLETLRQGFEAQGQNADDNAKFRSADISLQRRELALRKEDATGKSAQEEIAKEERALREKEGGMLNKIALGITDLGKDFKRGRNSHRADVNGHTPIPTCIPIPISPIEY